MTGAAYGFLAWCAITFATMVGHTPVDLFRMLFLLAPVVLVPLGFEVVRGLAADASPSLRLARVLWPLGAAFATTSFWVQTGLTAGLFAIGWAALCALAAVDGLTRLVRGGYRSVAGVCISMSFVYLFVGSAWLMLSRIGATPFQYSEATVLLAAVHFHFTGFVLPLVVAATALARSKTGGSTYAARSLRLVAGGILLGPALLAVGNVRHSPSLKLSGALLLVAASAGLSVLLASTAWRGKSAAARVLLEVRTRMQRAGVDGQPHRSCPPSGE